MSSLASSHSSLPSTPPAERRGGAAEEGGPPSTASSFSFYSPTSLAASASSFLRRFYTEPSAPTTESTSEADNADPHDHHPFPSSSQQGHADVFGGDGSNGVYFPPKAASISPERRPSPFQPLPLYPLMLRGLRQQGLAHGAQLLSRTLAEEIRLLIPPRLQLIEEWKLAYSLERDGVSLATLYQKCEEYRTASSRRGFVVVVKDGSGGLFGAYLSDAPHPSAHFYGTGECFLWRSSVLSRTSTPLLSSLPPPPSSSESEMTNLTRSTTLVIPRDDLLDRITEPSTSNVHDDDSIRQQHGNRDNHDHDTLQPPTSHPRSLSPNSAPSRSATPSETIRFKAFPYSGMNDYLIFCQQKFLSVGGGDGKYGLWLDDVFEQGVSASCPTFGNEPLSDQGTKFDVLAVEVWVVTS